ncbi:hypothetical protein ACVGWD_09940, partial [Enterobacter asburiae]
GRALEEVEYGGEYLRVIHGSALKKRWGGGPPPTLILSPPLPIVPRKKIPRPKTPLKTYDIRNIFNNPPIKKKKKNPPTTTKL